MLIFLSTLSKFSGNQRHLEHYPGETRLVFQPSGVVTLVSFSATSTGKHARI
jgi:hypothetical protein